jgi:hypothetical protein
MSIYIQLVLIALTTASVAMTITKAHLTEPLREWIGSKNETAGYLFQCPYCTSHWIAVGLLLGIGVSPLTLTFWLYAGAVVSVSTLIVGLMLKGLFMQESELQKLRSALKEARQVIAELQE